MTRRLWAMLACALLVSSVAGAAFARCEDFVPQPKPQNASRDIVGQELDAIVERGFIEFAVYEDFPPYSWEQGGTPRGIDIEIGNLIAEYLEVEPRFNFVAAGEDLAADLRFNLWKGALVGGRISNVMLRVPYDSEFACRVEQVVFTGQYTEESIAIAYDKASYPEDPPLPAYFRFDTVAVENDSISDFYLSSLARGQLLGNINRFPTMAEAMSVLAEGDVMAAMGPRAQLEFGLTDALDLHEPPLPGFAKGRWTIGLGVNFRYRPLAYAVDDAIRVGIEDGRIAAIHADYGLSYQAPDR